MHRMYNESTLRPCKRNLFIHKGSFSCGENGDGVSAEGSLVAFVILIIFCVGIL